MSERFHPLAKCEECPLRTEGLGYVPSKIPVEGRTRLVVVGEAPGFREAAYKEPFKGPSGQLINHVLRHHGYEREEVLYTNVVSCRPRDNTNPPPTAIDACSGRLMHEIVESGSRDVLALGAFAARSLCEHPGAISSLRIGPPKRPTYRLSGSAVERVVATWHPAYCLRNADSFPSLVSDVEKLTYDSFKEWQAPDWHYFDEVPLALEAIKGLQTYLSWLERPLLVIDIEVGIDKDTSFDHPNNYDLLCIGLGYAKGKVMVLGEEALKDEQVKQALFATLRSAKLVAHNGKFDLAGLYPIFPALSLYADTMLAHYALDERSGGALHGLKMLAVELLGAPQYDDEIKQYTKGGSYANIPRELLYRYNAYDVACTWDLWELFEPQLESEGTWPWTNLPAKKLRDVHDFMVGAANQLMYLELNGIAIDRTYNRELATAYLEKLADIERDIDAIVNEGTDGLIPNINPRSPKQVKAFLETQKVMVESTNADTLERLLGRVDPDIPLGRFLRTMLYHRREQKLYGTYVKGIARRLYRGRVYTTYMLHGTTSGRLASRNPNLQNVVRDKAIRRQFAVSKPGNIFVQADYKQAEGRVICWLARDEYLRSIFMDPTRDLFNELGMNLYGVSELEKEQRIRVKAYFYGLSFGRTAYSIAMEYGFNLRQTEQDLKGFFRLIPAVEAWQNDIRKKVLAGEDLRTPLFGRRRSFPLITDQNKKDVLNEALSYLPQSTASDICLSALVRLRPMLRGLGFIRLTIHDALVVECAEDKVEEVSRLLREVMVGIAADYIDYVPFAVDISTGTSWGDL